MSADCCSDQAFHADLPGFEGFREGFRDSQLVQAVIMRDLTKHLSGYIYLGILL